MGLSEIALMDSLDPDWGEEGELTLSQRRSRERHVQALKDH
jgi:hypothetical protein